MFSSASRSEPNMTKMSLVSSYAINPRRACTARVIVVIVCVCLVCPRAISLHEQSIAPQMIPRIQRRIKVDKDVGFSLKLLHSGVMV